MLRTYTKQEMKFSIKDFFSKCDQIRSFLRIWSHLLKKFLMVNFIFCAVIPIDEDGCLIPGKSELNDNFLKSKMYLYFLLWWKRIILSKSCYFGFRFPFKI